MASPIFCSSYLFLPWSIIVLCPNSSSHSRFNRYYHRRLGTCDLTARACHDHELKLTVSGTDKTPSSPSSACFYISINPSTITKDGDPSPTIITSER